MLERRHELPTEIGSVHRELRRAVLDQPLVPQGVDELLDLEVILVDRLEEYVEPLEDVQV